MIDQRPHPSNTDAEALLLGQLMSDPDAVIPAVRDCELRPEHFYRTEHGALFSLLMRMVDAGEHIDPVVTVPDRVMQGGQAERYGGLAYVVELPDRVPSTANAATYAQLILDKAARRQLLEALDAAREAVYASETAEEAIEGAATTIGEIQRPGRRRGVWLADATTEVLNENDEIAKSPRSQFIRSPWPEVDNILKVSPGDLIVIGGRPGMAKSAFILNWLLKVALDDVAGFFSLEMSKRQIVNRVLAMRSGITLTKIRTPKMYGEDDWTKLAAVEESLIGNRDKGEIGARLIIDETAGLTLQQVEAEARRWVHLYGCRAIGVDYLQLMRSEYRMPPEQRISEISGGLKKLAKDLHVPVFALSQLNREVENRNPPRPQVSDLRESGAIEQDADAIVFPYRPAYYPKQRTPHNRRKAEIIIAKQRQGPTGMVPLRWRGEYQVFESWPREERRRPPAKKPEPTGTQMPLESKST